MLLIKLNKHCMKPFFTCSRVFDTVLSHELRLNSNNYNARLYINIVINIVGQDIAKPARLNPDLARPRMIGLFLTASTFKALHSFPRAAPILASVSGVHTPAFNYCIMVARKELFRITNT